MADDTLKIEVAGKEFKNWSGVNISTAIDQIASGFAITSIFDPTSSRSNAKQTVEAARPFTYPSIVISIGGKKILTGHIEDPSFSFTGSESTVTLNGRSRTGFLIDCSIETYSYTGLTLLNLARQICQPFSIDVSLEGADTPPIFESRPKPGDKCFDFLKSLADPHGRILTDNPSGALVISENPVPEDKNVIASFVEGKDKFICPSIEFKGSERFSDYRVYAQVKGNPSVLSRVQDTSIPLHRPNVKRDTGTSFANTRQASEWERALAFSRAVSLTIVVPGWLNKSGNLWTKKSFITLRSPSLYVPKETKFLIAGVSYKESTGDKSTELTLVLPETYTRTLPDRFPWTKDE